MSKKNDLGQFYTPQQIAKLMVKWVLGNNATNLLDPAVGMGIFLSEARKLKTNIEMTAFEVDDEIISELKTVCDFDFTLYACDYLSSFQTKKYSAIICNPPYNKFQNIFQRDKYIKIFEDKYNIKLSGYSNLYIYFLIKSINELKSNGRCCYIIPYEFLNTGYGNVIKKYLLEQRIIKHIIKFDSNLKIFKDAVTTSCILCLEKTENNFIDFITIDNIIQLNNDFESLVINKINIEDIDYKEKWLIYFKNEKKYYNSNRLIPLSSIAKVKRGIATGNNRFFVLNKEKINKLALSENVCLPCITKASLITDYVFTTNKLNELIDNNKPMYLFNGKNAITKNDYAYIKYGEEEKLNCSFLNAHRIPWFSIENKEIAPILISVFNRDSLKIVRNEANVKNLTTFHGVYFNSNVTTDYINIFFCYLLTPIAQGVIKNNKREYGEGLDKFEPNDLNNALILDLTLLSQSDKEKILEYYEKIKKTNDSHYIDELNSIFKKYIN